MCRKAEAFLHILHSLKGGINLEDLIIVAILLVVIGLSAMYVIREKKKGTKCIGCPHSKSCGSHSETHTCNCGEK